MALRPFSVLSLSIVKAKRKSIPPGVSSIKRMPQMSRDLNDAQWAILDAIIPEMPEATTGDWREFQWVSA